MGKLKIEVLPLLINDAPIDKQEKEEFRTRWSLPIRTIAFFLVLSFFGEQVLWAADSDSAFKLRREKTEQDSKFLPRYLLEQQQKHEEFIQQKIDNDSLSRSLEDDLTFRLRSRRSEFEEPERRIGAADSEGELIQFTLSKETDENGSPRYVNIYEYHGRELWRITQYNATGKDISLYTGNAREMEGEENEKFKGGFTDFNKAGLSDDMIRSETYFEGTGKDRRVKLVLSGFENNIPSRVAYYHYDGKTLK
ncbi:MAG: hypothetical protein HYZ87_04235, partial [Candidatus Omnitrophica bacterium]|nr:hypothetical protein [Candidatus Omnitrophota bacterium]